MPNDSLGLLFLQAQNVNTKIATDRKPLNLTFSQLIKTHENKLNEDWNNIIKHVFTQCAEKKHSCVKMTSTRKTTFPNPFYSLFSEKYNLLVFFHLWNPFTTEIVVCYIFYISKIKKKNGLKQVKKVLRSTPLELNVFKPVWFKQLLTSLQNTGR